MPDEAQSPAGTLPPHPGGPAYDVMTTEQAAKAMAWELAKRARPVSGAVILPNIMAGAAARGVLRLQAARAVTTAAASSSAIAAKLGLGV